MDNTNLQKVPQPASIKIVKFIAIVSVLSCLFLCLINTASAAEESGSCGSSLKYSYSDGTLTISGRGEMYNYSSTGSNKSPWWDYKSSIKNVIFEDGVTSIGYCAFYNCGIRSIIIPNSVDTVGVHAFRECYYLESVTILNSETKWYSGAFPSDAEKIIAKGLLIDETRFDYFIVDNSYIKITNCDTSNASVSIPSTIEGLPVKVIGKGAFYGLTSITDITIPASVETIEANAFRVCTRLKEAIIPDSVLEIKENAFCGCSSLSAAVLGMNLKSIPKYCFYGCKNLKSVVIGLNITSIGDGSFSNTAVTNITIPSSVKSIGKEAFKNCLSFKRLTIKNGLESIGDNAFQGDVLLSQLYLPNTLTAIGEYAFDGCTALSTITLPDSLTSLGLCSFRNCNSLTAVTIPDNVAKINQSTFEGCSNLSEITLNENITLIEDSAFSGCIFSSIVLPESLISIGNDAFKNCTELSYIHIPNFVTSIGSGSFAWNTKLEKISVADSLKNIGENAFASTNNLEVEIRNVDGVIIDNLFKEQNIKVVNICNGIYEIGDYSFYNCPILTDVKFPKELTTLGDYSFAENTNISSLTITDKVTKIGLNAFLGCSLSIEIKYSTGEIASGLMKNQNVRSVIIDDGIKSIGNEAFMNCINLQTAQLSQAITSIDERLFYGCIRLNKVFLSDDTSYIHEDAFYGCDNCTLYCADNDYVQEYADYNFIEYCNTAANFILTITPPTKLEYNVGDELELAGLQVSLVKDDDVIFIPSGYVVEGYDAKTSGKQTITVSYKGQSAQFTVNVNPKPYKSINLIPPEKTKYFLGETADYNGLKLIITLDDDEIIEVFPDDKNITITGFDSSEVCENQIITVMYGDYIGSFEISINEVDLPLTTTTTKTTSTYTRFYVSLREELSKGQIWVGIYNDNGALESFTNAQCDGDNQYILTIPVATSSKKAKVFVWENNITLNPIGAHENVTIQ